MRIFPLFSTTFRATQGALNLMTSDFDMSFCIDICILLSIRASYIYIELFNVANHVNQTHNRAITLIMLSISTFVTCKHLRIMNYIGYN